jgi:hypothetical protein
MLQGRSIAVSHDSEGVVFTLAEEVTIHAGEELVLLA